jgi:hypothetical protein
MPHVLRSLRLTVAVGIAVATVGRVIDLSWHARHPEFETGMDQVQAHSVAWLGALILFVAAAVAVSRRLRTPGFVTILASASLYASVAVWHFVLHVQGRDPDLPHVLLAISQLGLYIGSMFVIAGLFIPRCNERFTPGRAQA